MSTYRYQKYEVITSLEDKIHITGQSITRITDNQRKNLISSVKTISDDWALRSAIGRNDTETAISALKNHRMRVAASSAIFFRNNGESISSRPTIQPEFLRVGESILEENKVTPHQIISARGKYYQVVISEIKAPRRIGWLCMVFPMNNIKDLLEQTSILNNLGAALFDDHKNTEIIATVNNTQDEINTLFKHTPPLSSQIKFFHETIRNRHYIVQRSPLSENERYSILVYGSTYEALSNLNNFWKQMASLFLVFTIIALCITYLMARGITRPLQILLTTAKKLERGDFSAEIDIHRKDEIGDLATAFKQMQKTIFEREKKVQESIKQLNHQATHDALTGLSNRRVLTQELNTANQLTSEKGEPYNILILDLDRFKVVNDTSGHLAGDALIVRIASILREAVYDDDIVVRLGGDEFAILLHNCKPKPGLRIANKIKKRNCRLQFSLGRDLSQSKRQHWHTGCFRAS